MNYQCIENNYSSFISKSIKYIKFQTPLTISCKKENESVMKCLIDHGANIIKNIIYLNIRRKMNIRMRITVIKSTINIIKTISIII